MTDTRNRKESVKNIICKEPSANANENAFLVAFFVYSLVELLNYTNLNLIPGFSIIDNLVKIPIAMTLVFLLLQAFFKNRKYCLLCLILIALSFLCYRTSGDSTIFWFFLFLSSAYHCDVKKLAKASICANCIVLALTLILFSCGIIQQSIPGGNRYSLGFVTPNRLAITQLSIWLAICVTDFEKKTKPMEAVVAIAFVLFMHVVTDSSAEEVMIVVATLFFYWLKLSNENKPGNWSRIGGIAICLVVSIIFVSLITMVLYSEDNPFMVSLNDLLSGRLYYAHTYFVESQLSLFGHDYSDGVLIQGPTITATTFLVDNMYCHLLLKFGIVIFVISIAILIASLAVTARSYSTQAAFFAIVVLAIFSFAETGLFYFETNFYFVPLFMWLYHLMGQTNQSCFKNVSSKNARLNNLQ